MKLYISQNIVLQALIFFLLTSFGQTAEVPSAWPFYQKVEVKSSGIVKLKIPYETLDKAHTTLRDIRVFDSGQNEVPYLLDQQEKRSGKIFSARNFEVTVENNRTVLFITTVSQTPLDAIYLQTPSQDFLKAVSIESSSDKKNWKTLTQNRPIFHQPNGAQNHQVEFPKTITPYLRVILEDSRSTPIPVTGIQLRQASQEIISTETIKLKEVGHQEESGETRLRLGMPYRHLVISAIEIEATDLFFSRRAQLIGWDYMDKEIQELTLADGTLYRVAVEGQPPVSQKMLEVNRKIPGRELTVLIQNEDNPPLKIKDIKAKTVPVYLVFFPPKRGTYFLALGHNGAKHPNYDLSSLKDSITKAKYLTAIPGPIQPNPTYKRADDMPLLPDTAGDIDVLPYRSRAPVKISDSGIQKLELSLAVLSRQGISGRDLRLVKDGKQIPYVIERPGIHRKIEPKVKNLGMDKKKGVSRWELELPYERLPITRLTCSAADRIFKRTVALYEERPDNRGDKYRKELGQTSWSRSLEQTPGTLTLDICCQPETKHLILEVENGDNVPLNLSDFKLHYLPTNLIFKASAGANVWLYYDNPKASSPRYDISLVMEDLLAAEKKEAVLQKEETLKGSFPWNTNAPTGPLRIVFWIVMAAVVVILLFVIVKLLPGEQEKL